jgi:hypothetical protein
MRRAVALSLLFFCACVGARMKSGDRAPAQVSPAAQADFYLSRTQPIFNRRCVVCHACVDAPCQLQLTSYDGASRGAIHAPPLTGTRVDGLPPTRLHRDASTTEQWRAKGFFPVLPEGGPPEASLLMRFLEAGKGGSSGAPDALRENPSCGGPGTSATFGMPFGLAPLPADEYSTLEQWVASGAPGPSADAAAAISQPSHPDTIARWEAFLNQDGPKGELVSRYLYEHVFLARLHFAGDNQEFYELVRSATPPGQEISELVTERPYDSVAGRVFFRLRRITDAITQKTHILWELDDAKLARLNALFFQRPWASDAVSLPGYSTPNPFKNFEQIPAASRARFMIENSRLIVDAMIRGPVCTGRTATYAIRDHFWIFFLRPESDASVLDSKLAGIDWPALDSREVIKHSLYQAAQAAALKSYFKAAKKKGYGPADIWDGGGRNRNAVLTVFRHESNASVHLGALGGIPETSWVLNYSNFERMYYNLVADFKPWGNIAHRMSTWTFMSFLRTEAESRFLLFIPPSVREKVRGEWTTGIGAITTIFQRVRDEAVGSESVVDENSPYPSLVTQFLSRLGTAVTGPPDPLNGHPPAGFDETVPIADRAGFEQALPMVTSRNDIPFARYLPNTSVVLLRSPGGELMLYTLVANRGYKFNNNFALEAVARDRALDTMVALPGVIGNYPELFLEVPVEHSREFLGELAAVDSDGSWRDFREHYGVHRGSPRFWSIYDEVSAWNAADLVFESGVLDLSHYDVAERAY